jgi:hypothetical protein
LQNNLHGNPEVFFDFVGQAELPWNARERPELAIFNILC